MQIRQFEYVQEIAKTGSIRQAAQKLYISQQALSETLKMLENELGFQVFQRSNKGVVPTEAGRIFLNDLEQVMALVYGWKDLAGRYARKYDIKISLQYLLGDLLVNTDLIERLSAIEHVSINWETSSIYEIVQQLRKGEEQLAILHVLSGNMGDQHLRKLQNQGGFWTKKLMDSQMMVIFRADDVLARRATLCAADLYGKQMVHNRAFGLTPHAKKLAEYTGREPHLFAGSVSAVEYVLQHRDAISYFPKLAMEHNMHIEGGKLQMRCLENDPDAAIYMVCPNRMEKKYEKVIQEIEPFGNCLVWLKRIHGNLYRCVFCSHWRLVYCSDHAC